jgi:ADP-heptose:LPS heptosyltransferase
MAAIPEKVLFWHQGALGDLILAGPALMALRRRFPSARLAAVGHPHRWRLLAPTLGLEVIWDGHEALWAWVHAEDGPLPSELRRRLEGMDLALVFRPRPPDTLARRLREAGVAQVVWVPSAPGEEREPLVRRQLRHLAALGIQDGARPFHLAWQEDGPWPPELPREGEFLVAAPGSGSPAKNWPLAHYYEVMRALSWEYPFPVVWVTGPAEAAWQPYLAGLARAQGHYLLHERPLPEVARVLARARLYLGNDSGLTHLAAAAGARQVLALFGPTDPRVWAPPHQTVTALQAPTGDLKTLSLPRVLQTARLLLAA